MRHMLLFLQDIDLLNTSYSPSREPFWPVTQQTGSFGGEFRARWQQALTLQFVQFNFLSDMYHA